MKLALIFALAVLFVPRCHAQPPMWYGHLVLPLRTDDCLRVASHVFDREGYRGESSGPTFVLGVRNTQSALIICGEAPERMTWVSVIVASSSGGADVAKREEGILQQRFDEIARRGGGTVTGVDGRKIFSRFRVARRGGRWNARVYRNRLLSQLARCRPDPVNLIIIGRSKALMA